MVGERHWQCAIWAGVVAGVLICAGARAGRGQELAAAPLPRADAPPAVVPATTEVPKRARGLVPNYMVVYTPHPTPLTAKQKFKLALRAETDPIAFAGAGVSAAYAQWENDPKNFGQGAEGYFKRVGATYGENAVGGLVAYAIVPSILRQEPRYIYKGTGSMRARFFYALSNSFICMGDNGHWQANVGQPMGSMATAAVTELQYPASDRIRTGRLFENFGWSEAVFAGENVYREFLSRWVTGKLGGGKQ